MDTDCCCIEMNWNCDDEEDDHALERQHNIEAEEAAAVDEMLASMRKKGMTIGEGWFIPPLAHMHVKLIKVGNHFHCDPCQRDQDPVDIPLDHPFCATLGALHAAKQRLVPGDIATLHLFAHLIFCPCLTDTLIHCRKFFNPRVIPHPAVHSPKMIKNFVNNIPVSEEMGGPCAALEMIEF